MTVDSSISVTFLYFNIMYFIKIYALNIFKEYYWIVSNTGLNSDHEK